MKIIIVMLLCAHIITSSALETNSILSERRISYYSEKSFVVSLRNRFGDALCVGCLITDTDIVTSARCILPYKNETNPVYGGIFVSVGTSFLTKRYDIHRLSTEEKTLLNANSGNNIGVVTLLKSVDAALATSVYLPDLNPDLDVGMQILLYGWITCTPTGSEVVNQVFSGKLRKIPLVIQDDRKTVLQYKERDSEKRRYFSKILFYALPEYRDEYLDVIDIGSPVIIENCLVGFLSFAKYPVTARNPALFSKVFPFKNFIEKVTRKIPRVQQMTHRRRKSISTIPSSFIQDSRRTQSFRH